MTLYQVLHELRLVLAVILGACSPLRPAINPGPARRRPRRN
jgi:hypothetical protein